MHSESYRLMQFRVTLPLLTVAPERGEADVFLPTLLFLTSADRHLLIHPSPFHDPLLHYSLFVFLNLLV